MSTTRKATVLREPTSISPKVSLPPTVLLIVAAVWSVINGDIDAEQITAAVSAIVVFVIGYIKSDSLSPADEVL